MVDNISAETTDTLTDSQLCLDDYLAICRSQSKQEIEELSKKVFK